jgi:hypothetical protein
MLYRTFRYIEYENKSKANVANINAVYESFPYFFVHLAA